MQPMISSEKGASPETLLYHLKWDWLNEVKANVLAFPGRRPDEDVSFEKLARSLTDAKLERLIWMPPVKDYYTFRVSVILILYKEAGFWNYSSWGELKMLSLRF